MKQALRTGARQSRVSLAKGRHFTAASTSSTVGPSLTAANQARISSSSPSVLSRPAYQCSRLSPRASTSSASITRPLSTSASRSLATPVDELPNDVDPFDLAKVERVSDEVDVCIVGGGPAGLSAAIRMMQMAKEQGKEDFRVVLLEKGGEVGRFQTNSRLYRVLDV